MAPLDDAMLRDLLKHAHAAALVGFYAQFEPPGVWGEAEAGAVVWNAKDGHTPMSGVAGRFLESVTPEAIVSIVEELMVARDVATRRGDRIVGSPDELVNWDTARPTSRGGRPDRRSRLYVNGGVTVERNTAGRITAYRGKTLQKCTSSGIAVEDWRVEIKHYIPGPSQAQFDRMWSAPGIIIEDGG